MRKTNEIVKRIIGVVNNKFQNRFYVDFSKKKKTL